MPMKLHTDYRNLPADALDCVIAVGSFDGVHEGHRALIRAARDIAARLKSPLGIITFEPHPREFFQPGGPPFRLTLPRAQRRIFESLGVDHLFTLPFDAAFSRLTGDDFVREVLRDSLKARHVAVGPDFHFGHKRSGSPATLKAAADKGAFGLTLLPAVQCESGARFSSTRIRAHIAKAELDDAAALLGYPWEMEAAVIPGDRRGRTIGYPTANQDVARYVRMPYGVYAVQVMVEGEYMWRGGAANFGIRPMFEVSAPLLETYIFDFASEIYGKQMRVRPVRKLRPEMNFDGLEALKAQIDRDCLDARAVLKSASLQESGQ